LPGGVAGIKGLAAWSAARIGMLGIEDFRVWPAYLLCILSAMLCVIYGARNWNRGDDSVEPADVQWAAEEEKAEQDL